MLKRSVVLASAISVLLVGVSGCGGGDGAEPGGGSSEEWPVRITTTGDVESTLNTNGSIFCGADDLGGADYVFELYAMSPPQQFNLRMNRDLAVGAHPIVGSDDEERYQGAVAYFYYEGPERRDFNQVENGTITIENIPTAAGEDFVATIEADMREEDGASIRFTADLDVTAGRQTFDECP